MADKDKSTPSSKGLSLGALVKNVRQGSKAAQSKAKLVITPKKTVPPKKVYTPVKKTSAPPDNTADYENYFAKEKKVNAAKTKAPVKVLKADEEDAPTALIAPSDYECVMAYDGGSPKKTATTKTAAAAAVDADDCPTALLAPADYENYFSNTKKTKEKKGGVGPKKTAKVAPPPVIDADDCPTALLAPADYQNYFSNAKKTKEKKGAPPPAPKKAEVIADDAPTALIAPDDYQNYFHNANMEESDKTKKKPLAKKSVKTEDDDLPTALIPAGRKGPEVSKDKKKGGDKKAKVIPSDAPTALIQQLQPTDTKTTPTSPSSRNQTTDYGRPAKPSFGRKKARKGICCCC